MNIIPLNSDKLFFDPLKVQPIKPIEKTGKSTDKKKEEKKEKEKPEKPAADSLGNPGKNIDVTV